MWHLRKFCIVSNWRPLTAPSTFGAWLWRACYWDTMKMERRGELYSAILFLGAVALVWGGLGITLLLVAAGY